MVVKNQIKFIKSLQQKKYRNQSGLFVAEGIKLVEELLNSGWTEVELYATEDYLDKNPDNRFQKVTDKLLKRMSGLKTPNKVLGVFKKPDSPSLDVSNWILALDDVQDPGNLGTIIRLCDWFGMRQLLCSPNTADCFNPKTLQATMGSIARVNVVYEVLSDVLQKSNLPSYGAFMDGQSVYRTEFTGPGILVMGNESKGIGKDTGKLLEHKIGIPSYGEREVESLNVAMATAIMLSEIRRPIRK